MAFLEDYTLLDELGQGGFATVYKVRHNKLGYIRAIRVLNAVIARGESDETYQKFLEECRLLLRLGNGNHPNIVHIYQPLLKEQKAIVEMDYVDGMDLFHFLEDRNHFVEIKDVFRLLHDIGSALAYCHEGIFKFCMDKNEDNLKDDPNDGSKVLLDEKTRQRLIKKYRVVHNDIHSGNIIRREDGSYILLDFGLAIDGESVIRSSRRRNGAPEFKAPEKWDNDTDLSTPSDIYSFGVVLYEMLAGRVPFVLDTKNSNQIEAEHSLYKAHLEQQPEPVFELRKAAFENAHPGVDYVKDYPDWLEALIMKCLSKSPDDRFKDGKELFDCVLQNESNNSTYQVLPGKTINKKTDDIIKDADDINNKETDDKKNDKEADGLIADGLIINREMEYLKTELDVSANKINALQLENRQLEKQSRLSKVWLILFLLSFFFLGYFIKKNHDLSTGSKIPEKATNSFVNEMFSKRDSLLNQN